LSETPSWKKSLTDLTAAIAPSYTTSSTRWLFHVRERGAPVSSRDRYAPVSLARDGFIHASFRGDVAESARLYFAASAALEVLEIDPRRLDAPVELAPTPRGPMPHIHGSIPGDAIRRVLALSELESSATDRVSGARLAFIAFEGMTLLDLVGVYDPLSRIASMGFDRTTTCEIVAAHGGPVWRSDGARFEVARTRPQLHEFDVVVVPGGLGSRALARDVGFIEWLRGFPDNRLIASVCTGALLLGAAGRLAGRRATTHASALAELGAFGAAAVSERVVDEGQVVTAGGVTSALDLGLHLVERLAGEEVARAVARQMEMRGWSARGAA